MNCLDCVNVLKRMKVGGLEETYCLLDFRLVMAIIECNRFKPIEVAVPMNFDILHNRIDAIQAKGIEKIEDHNPLITMGPEKYNEMFAPKPKHRGWPKGKKRNYD